MNFEFYFCLFNILNLKNADDKFWQQFVSKAGGEKLLLKGDIWQYAISFSLEEFYMINVFKMRNTILMLQAIARGNAQRKFVANIKASKGDISNKEKKHATIELSKITKIHTINLSKFDLDDPSTLAAYVLPGKFLVYFKLIIW